MNTKVRIGPAFKKKLKLVKKLLSDKKHWTTKVYARDRYSRRVDPRDKSAVRFCLIGACERVGGMKLSGQLRDLFHRDEEMRNLCAGTPTSLNDFHGYKAVMSFLEKYT